MKLLTLILPFVMLMIGCAVSKQIVGPDGSIMHTINCSGTALTMGDCLDKAGKICGSYGYDIIYSSQANHGNATSFNQYGLLSNPLINREIVIQCKNNRGMTSKSIRQESNKENKSNF